MQTFKMLALAVLCAIANKSQAQNIGPNPPAGLINHELNEVVITGTSTPHALSESPIQTEVLTRQKIETLQVASLEDALNMLSPSFSTQPTVMGNNLSMNGLSNDYILILVNGRRVIGDFSGSVDLSRIDMDQVERIEIVKGAAAALYGSDAMGGVINIITRSQLINPLQGSSVNRISAFGTRSSSTSVQWQQEGFSSRTGFVFKTTDGWQLSPWELGKEEKVPTKKMAMHPQKDFRLDQHLAYNYKNLEVQVGGALYQRELFRPTAHYSNDYRFDDHQWEAALNWQLARQQNLKLETTSQTFSYTKVFTQETDGFKQGVEDLSKLQRLNQLRLVAQLFPGEMQQLIIGAEWQGHHMESPNLPKTGVQRTGKVQKQELGLWIQEEWAALPQLDLVVGFRHSFHEDYGHHSAPKVALQYKPGPFRFRANVSAGYKTPTLLQLYYSALSSRGLQTYGNTELEPETGMYTSLSAEYVKTNFSLVLSGFYNDIRKMIELQLLDEVITESEYQQGIRNKKRYQNLGETYTRGVEAMTEWRPAQDFQLSLAYSYTHARGRSEAGAPYLPLPKISEHAATCRLGWNRTWQSYVLRLSLNGRYEGEKYFADGNSKAYQQWDLNSLHTFKKHPKLPLTLGVGIRNLFDQTDNSPFGSNYANIDPGRRLQLSIQIAFNR